MTDATQILEQGLSFSSDITVYSKPSCVQCDATKDALSKRGIPFKSVDLTEDAVAFERVTSLGYRQAPVVIAGDAHWSGFRPDRIATLAKMFSSEEALAVA